MDQGWAPPDLRALFLAITILTGVTGFLFPFDGMVKPSYVLGAISLALLATRDPRTAERQHPGPGRG